MYSDYLFIITDTADLPHVLVLYTCTTSSTCTDSLCCPQAIEASGLSLAELAALDDAGLRKAGLITVRSRQAVTDELRRLGLKE